VLKTLLECNLAFICSSTARLCWKTESQNDFHLWPIDLKINMDHLWTLATVFRIKCYCDLDLWPKNVKGSSIEYDKFSYQVPWLSPRNFSWYWADMVLVLNATVTLTFDLLTSKRIGVIYWPWPIIVPSRMTVTHKLFKILSRHVFCIKYYCDLDLWPSDLKIYRGHPLTMTNLSTK